jgi:hypothetical protein
MKLPIIKFEEDYTGIVFGFELSFSSKRLVIAFLFWGFTIIFR